MNINISGYNVDKRDIINNASPEVISASYARISRSVKSIQELRDEARADVQKARESNNTIVYDYGHSSIAEATVFNIDLEDISRLALEEIEKHRFISFTEKSQRYVCADKNIQQSSLISRSLEIYYNLISNNVPKEDARYYLTLGTLGSLGMTINARALEHLIISLQSTDIKECKDIAEALFNQSYKIAPSLIKYVEPTDYTIRINNIHTNNNNHNIDYLSLPTHSVSSKDNLFYDKTALGSLKYHWELGVKDLDKKVLSFILARKNNIPVQTATILKSNKSKHDLFAEELFADLSVHDSVLKDLEHFHLTFEVVGSASLYAQLKRHRILNITTYPYHIDHGFTHPIAKELIKKFKIDTFLQDINEELQLTSNPYLFLNGHRRRLMVTGNLRAFYNFSRLREDKHAQWDIRGLAIGITNILKKIAPLTCEYMKGKSDFIKV